MDKLNWNTCMFCGKEIFSITYKPFIITASGVKKDEGSQIILQGAAHKECKDKFLRCVSWLALESGMDRDDDVEGMIQ